MQSSSFERLDSLLSKILEQSPLRRGLQEQEVLSRWPQIVGEEIARHSRALGFRDGVLLIAAESSVWAQELSLLKPTIRQKLEERLGEGSVRDIRFTTGREFLRSRGEPNGR